MWGRRQQRPERRRDLDFVVGLDLGQSRDYTALAVLELVAKGDPDDPETPTEYHLRHLERPELGTRYPAIVERVLGLLDRAPLSRETPLVVDRTGVGRAIGNLFVGAGIDPELVTIHGGDEVQSDGRHHRVPKRDLVGVLVALYQTGRLKVARDLDLAPALTAELLNFRVKVDLRTAHDSYEAWRESTHDDLVLATAMACWYAEYRAAGRRPIDEDTAHRLRGMASGDYQPWAAPGWGGR